MQYSSFAFFELIILGVFVRFAHPCFSELFLWYDCANAGDVTRYQTTTKNAQSVVYFIRIIIQRQHESFNMLH